MPIKHSVILHYRQSAHSSHEPLDSSHRSRLKVEIRKEHDCENFITIAVPENTRNTYTTREQLFRHVETLKNTF